MEIVKGQIVGADAGGLTIRIPYANWERFATRQYEAVEVALADGRTLTPDQRRKAYALLNEIADWSGETVERIKLTTKHDFVENHLEGLKKELFSLSNCDVTTAREFISYLIEFIMEWDVPTRSPLAELADDAERYLYASLFHRKCAVCGKHADVHHVDRVGSGRNRETIVHVGMLMEALCRTHHTECHTMPQDDFDNKYHIAGIKADARLCKRLGLKAKAD